MWQSLQALLTLQTDGKSNARELVMTQLSTNHASTLLVLDNFETVVDIDYDAALRILNDFCEIDQSLIVRYRGDYLPLDWSWSLDLEGLEKDDARSLYIAQGDRRFREDLEADQELDALLDLLAGSPLAISVVAQIPGTPSDALQRWRALDPSILQGRGQVANSVAASINLSLTADDFTASPTALRLMQLVAILPAGAASQDLYYLGIADSALFVDAARAMCLRKALITERAGRLLISPPIRLYLQSTTPSDHDRNQLDLFYCSLVPSAIKALEEYDHKPPLYDTENNYWWSQSFESFLRDGPAHSRQFPLEAQNIYVCLMRVSKRRSSSIAPPSAEERLALIDGGRFFSALGMHMEACDIFLASVAVLPSLGDLLNVAALLNHYPGHPLYAKTLSTVLKSAHELFCGDVTGTASQTLEFLHLISGFARYASSDDLTISWQLLSHAIDTLKRLYTAASVGGGEVNDLECFQYAAYCNLLECATWMALSAVAARDLAAAHHTLAQWRTGIDSLWLNRIWTEVKWDPREADSGRARLIMFLADLNSREASSDLIAISASYREAIAVFGTSRNPRDQLDAARCVYALDNLSKRNIPQLRAALVRAALTYHSHKEEQDPLLSTIVQHLAEVAVELSTGSPQAALKLEVAANHLMTARNYAPYEPRFVLYDYELWGYLCLYGVEVFMKQADIARATILRRRY